MRILVTGGAGLIGSNVVKHFINLGHDVHVVDNLWRGKLENLYSEGEPVLDLDSNFNIQNITNIAPLANFRSKFHASTSGNKIISLDLSISGGGSICVDGVDYNYTTADRYQNVLILRF